MPGVLDMKYRSELKHGFPNPEAVARRCSVKKVLLEILQNSQENTSTTVSLFPQVCNFIKGETLTQVFSCEFCEISKNTLFREHLRWLLLLIVAICTVLFWKLYIVFKKKRALKSRDMQFFLQNVPNEIFKIFEMFENNMKFIRATCWVNSKISSRDKDTALILIFSLLLVIIMV